MGRLLLVMLLGGCGRWGFQDSQGLDMVASTDAEVGDLGVGDSADPCASRIVCVSLETGSLEEYDATSGAVAASSSAALRGSSYGTRFSISDVPATATKIIGPLTARNRIRVRGYVGTDGVVAADNVAILYITPGDASQHLGSVFLAPPRTLSFAIAHRTAISTGDSLAGSYPLAPGPHSFEVDYVRSTGDNPDGFATLAVDGNIVATSPTVANDRLFQTADRITIGHGGLPIGSSGTLDIDEIVVDDDTTPIGP